MSENTTSDQCTDECSFGRFVVREFIVALVSTLAMTVGLFGGLAIVGNFIERAAKKKAASQQTSTTETEPTES